MSRRIVAGVVAVALLVAIGVGAWLILAKRATRASQVAAASLAHCLLGAPLAPGEAAELRLHRIIIGGPPADWPARCNGAATGLARALDRAGRKADADDVRAALGSGFDLQRFEREPVALNIPALVAGVEPAPDVPRAPPPASAPDDRVPLISEKSNLAGTSGDPVPGARLNVVVGGSQLCAFSEGLDVARCAPLAKHAPIGAQGFLLWPPGDEGGSVWITDHLLSDNRAQRFFRSDTGTLFAAKSPDRAVYAHTHGENSFVTLEPSDQPGGGWKLSSWTGAKRDTPLELDLSFKRLGLFSDRMVWVARGQDDDWDHLMSAALTREPFGLGKPVDHGVIEVVPDTIEGCRTKDALAVVLTRGSDSRVLFYSGDTASDVHRAKLRADAKAGARSLSCSASAVTLTRVVETARKRSDTDTIGYVAQHAICTKLGCVSSEIEVDAMLDGAPDVLRPSGKRPGEVVAAGLDGKLLLVWRSASRGIRARLAEPGGLPGAADVLVFDDGVSAGRPVLARSVVGMHLVARRSGAVLLLEVAGERGVLGLRISPDGAVAAVAPKG